MKVYSAIAAILLLALGASAGWFFAQRNGHSAAPARDASEKEIAFYQSPMHPWIKSDQPGNCTICGMKLSPVFEGEAGFDVEPGTVALGSNIINVINVQTEPVRQVPLTRTLQVAGRIETDKTRYRVISAYIGGRIEELFVNYLGAEVRAGEPLATLYSPELLSAEREFLSLLNGTNLTRSATSATEHQRLLAGARARLKQFGLQEAQIDQLAEKPATNYTTQITAPISGTVLTRDAYEGQYVQAGDKLFEIADLSTMWFRFDVYEQDLPWIHPGQIVRVTTPALAGRHLEGPITFIEPTVNQTTRSAKVRVELQNPLLEEGTSSRRALFDNLYADGTILIETEPVLAVPRTAILQPGDFPRVYVETGGGAYEMVRITLGRKGDRYWEILEGLDGTEQVVTSGNFLIDSEAQVQTGGAAHQHSQPEETAPQSPAQSPAHDHSADESGSLTPEQQEAARRLFDLGAEMNQGFAADDAQPYIDQLPALSEAVQHLHRQFTDTPWSDLTRKILEAVNIGVPASLDVARKQYLPLSNELGRFALALTKAQAMDSPAVFQCPMYPRMGQKALWVQKEGPLRNPFYGSEMLECGVELK